MIPVPEQSIDRGAAPAATTERRLCGWRVRSALPLPGLPLWPQDDPRPVDIEIGFGPVPPALDNPRHAGAIVQFGTGGLCRFALPRIGAFLLHEGRRITIARSEAATDADLRLFLLGSVFGLLCHQRGLLPLHASAVRIDGRVVAFSGPSGVGKSTLAAAMAARGHKLVADDVLVIDPAAAEGPAVRPLATHLRLWRSALEALGHAGAGLEQAHAQIDKYVLPVQSDATFAPLPLGTVIHLETVQLDRLTGIRPLAGIEAVMHLRQAVYRPWLADRMGRTTAVAAAALQLAGRLQQHVRLGCLPGFERLPDTVARIEALVAEAA